MSDEANPLTAGPVPGKDVVFDVFSLFGETSWVELTYLCRVAEENGYRAMHGGDHLGGWSGSRLASLEGWTVLAALAATSQRVRLGLLVSSNTFRHPVMLAKIAATLDVISGGRVELGVGAGWSRREHAMFGLEFRRLSERVEQLDEGIAVIKLLWSGEPVTFQGRHYRLGDAQFEPELVQKPHPPIIVGGCSRSVLETVARHADGWNVMGSMGFIAHRTRVLQSVCEQLGRDPAEIQHSVSVELRLCDSTKQAATATKKRREELEGEIARGVTSIGRYKLDHEDIAALMRGRVLIGTAPQIAEQVCQFHDLGIGRVVLWSRGGEDPRQFEWFVSDVAPLVP